MKLLQIEYFQVVRHLPNLVEFGHWIPNDCKGVGLINEGMCTAGCSSGSNHKLRLCCCPRRHLFWDLHNLLKWWLPRTSAVLYHTGYCRCAVACEIVLKSTAG